MIGIKTNETGENGHEKHESVVKMKKRRMFQRQACLLSVMAAFAIGLSLGVFVPVIGLGTAISNDFMERPDALSEIPVQADIINTFRAVHDNIPDLEFPTIYDIRNVANVRSRDSYAVTFVNDRKPSQEIASHGNAIITAAEPPVTFNSSARKDTNENRERKLGHNADGKRFYYVKRLNKHNGKKYVPYELPNKSLEDRTKPVSIVENNDSLIDIIDDNIFWGQIVEEALPSGFNQQHTDEWNAYVQNSVVTKLEIGCGRMQNRLVTFQDGRQACARYRQNTDQIQGELFSFYLGQLLNLTNLAPSTATLIDFNSNTWLPASQDIQNAQWKSERPVVLTNWIPNLEAANIPLPFQPMERHLNKFDVKNITLGLDESKPPKGLLDHLGGIKKSPNWNQLPLTYQSSEATLNHTVLNKLIELAQWSDLIVFDYLIANLDRVVNNLYNFQWNADIMAAPAHNLARQSDSQLLVFLDNESGLLHGYRLLKKYETYHGLLLDNLCVFRRLTIDALKQLRTDGISKRLQQLFEQSTTDKVRDVLPSLPDKSIKILVDRIDRVLGQVQKCRELFSSR